MGAATGKSGGSLSHGDYLLIFTAGVMGEIVLEFLAWVIFPHFVPKPPMMPMLPPWVTEMAPAAIGMPMRPNVLLADLGRSLFGLDLPVQLTVAVHLLLGFFIMPLVYVKAKQALKIGSWLVAGTVWGIVLWLIAQAVLAPLAGRPIFLGFIPYSWGSLGAHVIYALVVAWSLERLRARFPALSQA